MDIGAGDTRGVVIGSAATRNRKDYEQSPSLRRTAVHALAAVCRATLAGSAVPLLCGFLTFHRSHCRGWKMGAYPLAAAQGNPCARWRSTWKLYLPRQFSIFCLALAHGQDLELGTSSASQSTPTEQLRGSWRQPIPFS